MSVTQIQAASARPPPGLWANMGGPQSRQRSLRITSTLLGGGAGPVRCAPVRTLALDFGSEEPVGFLQRLLDQAALQSPEALRALYPTPPGCLLAAPAPTGCARLDALAALPAAVLEQALLLGLCTSHVYDPTRPVLWTQRSLTRALELFDPEGFYA